MVALAPARYRAVQPAADVNRDLARYALCTSRAGGGQSKCGLYESWVWACVPSSYLRLLLALHSRAEADTVAATGVDMVAVTGAGSTRAAGAAAMPVASGMAAAAGARLALRCVRFGRQVAGVGAAAYPSGSASA